MERTAHRRVALAGFVLLAVVTAACSGGGGGDQGGGAAGGAVDASRCPVDALDGVDEPVSIDFWHAMTAENEATLAELVEEYHEAQDRVRVNLVYQGTYDQVSDKFLAALRGGDLPALVQLEETRIQLAIDSQAMLPAQACVETADYDLSDHLDPVIDQFSVEDVLWPMPFNTSNPILYYNAKMFEAAGIGEDEVPTTLEEVRAVSQRIVDSGRADHGLALELKPWYVEQWFAKAGQPLVDNDNGRSGRATEVNLDAEIADEVVTWVDEMMADGLATNVGRNEGGQDHFIAVATERAAMTIGSSGSLGSVLEVLDQGQFPNVGVGVAPLPGPSEGGVLVGGAALWLVERGTSDEEQAAAWDLASWLNEPAQQATWHIGTGYVPIRRSVAEDPEVAQLWQETPEFRVAYDQLLESGAELGGPVVGDYAGLRDAIVEALERVILEDTSPDEALDAAKEEADEAIQSYNDRVGG